VDPASPYTGENRLDGLGDLVRDVMSTQVALELIDEVYVFSEPVTVPIRELNEVGLDAMCDAMNVCADPLTCSATTMLCEAPPEIAAACAGATPLVIDTPTTTTTSTTVMGSFAAGDGLFSAPADCSDTPGMEHLYALTVPDGRFDVILNTDLPASDGTDTVIYMRSSCPDPRSDAGCSDDIDYPDNPQTLLELPEVAPGTYTVFVERWADDAGPMFALQVSLRPILESGAACDPMGVMNRCAGMPCAAATMMCP
jgi:hypothetical protein